MRTKGTKCKCGCGQLVRIGNKYLQGHNTRGGNFWSRRYHEIWNRAHPEDQIRPKDGNVIHHKDFNHNNNNLDNLQKMSDVEHKKLHTSDGRHPNQGRKFSPELRHKLSIAHIGQKAWNKGLPCSKETKAKISSKMKGRPSSYGMLGKHHSEETKQKMRGRIPWNKGK